MIKLIVGLGNPGQQYEKTRHNAGFIFLDALAGGYHCSWQASGQFQGETTSISVGGNKLILLKPGTYMNRSGASVGSVLRYFKFKPEEMLVVHDELELPEGVAKLKRDGGHAGHNGLRDIITHIQTRDFYRLRVGVGRPQSGANVADYVLSKPSIDGLILLENVCGLMIEKIESLLHGDLVAVNQ